MSSEPQKYYLHHSFSRWVDLSPDGKTQMQRTTYYLSKVPPPHISPFEYSTANYPRGDVIVYVN